MSSFPKPLQNRFARSSKSLIRFLFILAFLPLCQVAFSQNVDRMYVIVNHTGGIRDITTYTDLSNASVGTIGNNTSITLMSDGTGWFQVK